MIKTRSRAETNLVYGAVMAVLGIAPAAHAQTPARFEGQWTGNYQCHGQPNNAISLDIEEVRPGVLTGTVSFTLKGAIQASGSYRVRGQATPGSRQFRLVPTEWIDRANGVQPSGLTGELNDGGRSMQGVVTACPGAGQAFTMSRAETSSGGDARAIAVEQPMPRSGGPMEGRWTGRFRCGAGEVVPLDLDIAQDGRSFVALVSTVRTIQSRKKTETFPGRGVFRAEGDPAAGLDFVDRSMIDGHLFTRITMKEAGPGRLLSDIHGLAGVSGCETATLQRLSAPRFPDIPPRLLGEWAGAFHHGDSLIALRRVGESTSAEWRMTTPRGKPASQQYRFAARLVPVLVNDQAIVFAPLTPHAAEGIYGQRSLYYTRYFSLVSLAPSSDGEAEMGTHAGQSWPNRRSDMRAQLSRVDRETGSALQAGASPKARFPAAIGGQLTAARTLDDQCSLVREWAKPFTSTGAATRATSGRRNFVAALPLFEDRAFEPVFGLPYGSTTKADRLALRRFMQESCSRRFQMRELDATVFTTAFMLESGGGGFDDITSGLVNRASTLTTFSRLLDEVSALEAKQASLVRLDAIERQGRSNFADVGPDDEDAFLHAIRDRRRNIERVILKQEANEIAAAPDVKESLSRIVAYAEKLARTEMPPSDKEAMAAPAKTKAAAILESVIESDFQRIALMPAGLGALSVTQAALKEWGAQLTRLPAALRSDRPQLALQRLQARYRQIGLDPATVGSFAAALEQVQVGGDPEAAVRNTALRYVAPEDLDAARSGLPEIARLYRTAVDRMELRSIAASDRSVPNAEGEPSLEEMVSIFQTRMRGINRELAQKLASCHRREYGNDPLAAMECLTILTTSGGGTESPKFRIVSFEKIGCAKALQEAGYMCDYLISMSSTSPVMQNNSIARLLGRQGPGKARFVRTAGGWTAFLQESTGSR